MVTLGCDVSGHSSVIPISSYNLTCGQYLENATNTQHNVTTFTVYIFHSIHMYMANGSLFLVFAKVFLVV